MQDDKIQVEFLEDAAVELSDDEKLELKRANKPAKPAQSFTKGRTYTLAAASAAHWVRRGKAVYVPTKTKA